MSVVTTVLKYDFKRFLRDRLMLAFSVVILIMYVAVAAFVPDDIAPDWKIAVTDDIAARIESKLKADAENDVDIQFINFADDAAMKKAFDDGEDAFVGIALADGGKDAMARGEQPVVHIYVDETSPPDMQRTARAVGAMLATALFLPDGGERVKPEMLGPVVEKTNFAQQSRGLMAIFILMMEMLALGSLVSREITSGVVHGILTTVVSLPRYFFAKMVFGVVLAFVQATFVAALTGGMTANPPLIAAHLFLGAVLFTAMGIIAGTRGKHLMEVMMWGVVMMLPAAVPALAVMLPGTASWLVQSMPTYPLVHGVLTAGQAAPLVAPAVYLLWSGAWALVVVIIAYAALRGRVK